MKTDQEKVLEYLAENLEEDFYTHFKPIADSLGISIKRVRRACRALRKKGHAEYVSGLMTDEGEVAGSGYRIIPGGRRFYADNNSGNEQPSRG